MALPGVKGLIAGENFDAKNWAFNAKSPRSSEDETVVR